MSERFTMRAETFADASTGAEWTNLVRVEGPPPITDVPDEATVLVECPSLRDVSYFVLNWCYYGGVDEPCLSNWYEPERGVSGCSNITAHYRLSPSEWARGGRMDGRFTMNTETFHDHDRGLEWTVAVSEPLTWAAAHDYARDCRAGGHDDWRVPERPELDTLVDLSTHSPATWPALRDCTPSGWYWTATPFAPSSGYAWVVYFDFGYAYSYDVCYSRRVRCVRGGER